MSKRPTNRQLPLTPSEPGARAHRAVMIVGHGSLRPASGASMIRLAARAQQAGAAPIVQAAFLNYSRPSVVEGLARCVARGASELIVVPYFLVPGWFVRQKLPRLLEDGRAAYPGLVIRQANPLGDHPALARLVMQRAVEADYLHCFPRLRQPRVSRQRIPSDAWRPTHLDRPTGLLLIAHGSPDPENNLPIHAVAGRISAAGRYAAVRVCFMDLNEPGIGEAVSDLASQGIRHVVAVPYFLQLGNHVADDLPAAVGGSQAQHPEMTLILGEHLGYDCLLVPPILDRVAEALQSASPAAGQLSPVGPLGCSASK